MLCLEPYLPYDRTMLNKSIFEGHPDDWRIYSKDFFRENEIDIRLDTTCLGINTKKQNLQVSDGKTLDYHKLCIASGGMGRRLDFPGSKLNGVYVMRKAKHHVAIQEMAKTAKKVVILGSSFIGSEIAAYLRMMPKRNIEVHLVGMEEFPMEIAFGKEIGKYFLGLHEQHGVHLHMGKKINKLIDDRKGAVQKAVLSDGTFIDCDMVIVGAGINLNTEIWEGAGLKMADEKTKGIMVNEYM